jgi:hypothetical protein
MIVETITTTTSKGVSFVIGEQVPTFICDPNTKVPVSPELDPPSYTLAVVEEVPKPLRVRYLSHPVQSSGWKDPSVVAASL